MDGWESRLSRIRGILLCLSTPQQELEASLEELRAFLLQFALENADRVEDVKDRCFSDHVAKALVGILRSSSQKELLALSCKCLSLIAHGSEESRQKLGEQMGAIQVLVDVLNECTGSMERVSVCEQAILCLRKITFHNVTNQVELARKGGIKMITKIAMDSDLTTNYGNFSEDAIRQVEELVLRKKFIARVVLMNDKEKNDVLLAFPSIRSFPLAKSYPMFSIDLITKDKISVSERLVECGAVWPSEEVAVSDFNWTVVMVQAVETGSSLWCQFCRGNQEQAMLDMRNALDSLVAPDVDGSGHHTHPMLNKVEKVRIGETYLSYCSAPTTLEPATAGEVPANQWFRLRVLEVGGSMVKTLAIDFGFTLKLATETLFSLTKECRGIPPQAIPCRLRGVAPAPASVSILENSAALIRNMAFEKEVFGKEIVNFKGVEAMIKIAVCRERGVVLEALGALVNLIIIRSLRESVAAKGALEVALKILKSSQDGEIVKWAIGILLNGLTDCPANVTLFRKLDGESILKSINMDEVWGMEKEILKHWMEDIFTLLSRREESMPGLEDTPTSPAEASK